MKITDFKVGDCVKDKWYGDWGIGTVVEVLKTRIKIDFNLRDDISTFDEQHLVFLEKVK